MEDMFSWIVNKFKRRAHLARPQILTEIQRCKVKMPAVVGTLREWMNRWNLAVERLVDIGSIQSDLELLYMAYRESFMLCTVELAGPIARVQRSSEDSSCHTYDWLYNAASTTLANMEATRVEEERRNATFSNATNPLTPATQVALTKGQTKEQARQHQDAVDKAVEKKLKEMQISMPAGFSSYADKSPAEKKLIPCARLVRGEECRFSAADCFYSHDSKLVAKGKADKTAQPIQSR